MSVKNVKSGTGGKPLLANDTKVHSDHSITTVTVKPGEQRRVVLGEYTADNTPTGFSVDYTPQPYPEGSVETQITSVGTVARYRMVLFVANYGTHTVTAEVRQL